MVSIPGGAVSNLHGTWDRSPCIVPAMEDATAIEPAVVTQLVTRLSTDLSDALSRKSHGAVAARDRLEEIRDAAQGALTRSLGDVLASAVATVPFYEALHECAAAGERLTLRDFPLLTRTDLRRRFAESRFRHRCIAY